MPAASAAVGMPIVEGADGPMSVGARVQTQWTKDEGGNDSWHAGRVVALQANGEVAIRYDDGDD